MAELVRGLELWPRELLPIVANYVRARTHEWTNQLVKSDKTSSVTNMRIDASPYLHEGVWHGSISRFPSKYTLDIAPTRFAVDVEFASWEVDTYVWITIFSNRFANEFWGMLLVQRQHAMEISCVGYAPLFTRALKNRIYVAVDKEKQTVFFELADQSLQSRVTLGIRSFCRSSPQLCELYPRVTIENGNPCSVSFVQDS